MYDVESFDSQVGVWLVCCILRIHNNATLLETTLPFIMVKTLYIKLVSSRNHLQ